MGRFNDHEHKLGTPICQQCCVPGRKAWMNAKNEVSLHRMGIIGMRVKIEPLVHLRTEDRWLKQQMLKAYPGLNPKTQFRIEPWLTYRGRQRRIFVFENLKETTIKAWLEKVGKTHKSHASTQIYTNDIDS